jgi:branched-chain amino acid transport system ATP-binding protein
MTEPLLELEDVHSYYGNIHALRGVTLSVAEGEIVTLIGGNGAGKSTTLNSISGLVRPRSGHIRLRGEDLSKYQAHEVVAQGVVQVPEGRRTFARLTVLENLEMGAFIVKGKAIVQERIERVFELFPRLKERKSQIAGTLSGGEQ